MREREKNWERESPDMGKNEMIHKIERQKASERDVAAERRKKIPTKPQGDLITRLPIDLFSCDLEITSLNQ